MDAEDERDRSVLLGRAIEAAKANRARIDGSIASIEQLIAKHEIVYWVWPNTTPGRGGYELMAIKGAGLVRGIVARGETHCASATGILCDNYEQVVTIQRALRARKERLSIIARRDGDGSGFAA
jgi:hypothetical protein